MGFSSVNQSGKRKTLKATSEFSKYENSIDGSRRDIVISKNSDGKLREGGVMNIDMNDIEMKLSRLRQIADKPIKNLSEKEASDFRSMIRHTQFLYDTDDYSNYFDKIRSIFGDLKSVVPGTVGAYFIGCTIPTSMEKMPGCSVICASSVPPPRGQKGQNNKPFEFCKYTVIWATLKGDGYEFKTLHEADPNNIIVYVDNNGLVNSRFPGFNGKERKQLKDYGCKNVNVLRYSDDGKSYNQLLGGFVKLDDSPSRVEVISDNSNLSPNNTLIAILLIILVIIVIFIGWKMSRK